MNTISKTKLVLLAVVLVGVLFGLSQFSATKDLSGLVTYTNEELGFELQHPKGWEVAVDDGDDGNLHRVIFAKEGATEEQKWWKVYRRSLTPEENDFELFQSQTTERIMRFSQLPNQGIKDVEVLSSDFDGRAAFSMRIVNDEEVGEQNSIEFETMYIHDNAYVWFIPTNRVNKEGVNDPCLDIETYRVLIDTFKIL